GLPTANPVGDLHHELRLLGRHRPLRHVDLSGLAFVPRALAYGRRPRFGSDDSFRGDDSGPLPDYPPGPSVVLLLALSIPEPAWAVVQFPIAAQLGRLRHLDVSHRQYVVPVPGPRSRHRRGERPSWRLAPARLPIPGSRLGRQRSANGGHTQAPTVFLR